MIGYKMGIKTYSNGSRRRSTDYGWLCLVARGRTEFGSISILTRNCFVMHSPH